MRLLNDKSEEASEQKRDPFEILVHATLCGLGLATVILGPLPIIFAEARLVQPWPKVTAVAGALIALLLFSSFPLMTGFSFVLGVFVADSVQRRVDFWPLLYRCIALAIGMAVSYIGIYSWQQQISIFQSWPQLIQTLITYTQLSVPSTLSVNWDALLKTLIKQGPFLYLSLVLLCVWLSLGIAAHLGWQSSNSQYNGSALRALKMPSWLSLLFLSIFIPSLLLKEVGNWVMTHALLEVGGVLMFIGGCIQMSRWMFSARVPSFLRTLLYSVTISLGPYILIGLGVLAPCFQYFQDRRSKSDEGDFKRVGA